MAFLVIVLLAATAAVVGWNASQKPAPAPPADDGPDLDIFAGVPDDQPRARDEGESSSPFADIEAPVREVDPSAWEDALDYARRAEVALREALSAQSAGLRDLARERGAEAQTLYSRALEVANPYLAWIASQYGRNDPTVRDVDRQTQLWAKELVLLRKSTGI